MRLTYNSSQSLPLRKEKALAVEGKDNTTLNKASDRNSGR